MRIGLVCPYSMAVWGGVQQQVLGLGRTLRAKGHSAQVLAPCDGIPPEPWVTPLGNSMPYVQNGSIAPLAPDPAAQLRALGAIWDERFDVLHLHEPLAPGATLTTLVVKPVPLVGTFHANGDIAAYRYMRPLLRRLVRRLDSSVAVSDEAAKMANEHLNTRCQVLYNGIEVERFSEGPVEAREIKTILFISRHEPRKGLEVLIEASQLMDEDVIFVIGGEGPETERLAQLASGDGRFEFLGSLSDARKRALIRGADVFCAPAIGGESFGVVLLEAMAAGTSVVASNIPAFRAVSRNGAAAILTETGNPTSLAKGLSEAIRGEERVVDAIEVGRELAFGFSMDSLADAYLAQYDRVVH